MRGSRFLFFHIAFALFCLTVCGLSHAAPSANPLVMETEDQRLVRWDLTAESITTLNDSEIMEAKGNVFLKRGNEYLKADFARYYMSTKWVYLQGNVVVHTGKDELQAEEAEFDLRSRVGWLKKGRIFMAGPHAYLAGDRIDKHWGDVYTFKQAKVTTCDGDAPAWSIAAEEAVVEIDGYARLSRSTFQVKDTPVAYTPYFLFPTKTTRQTGLLIPEYGRSSNNGVYYNQPFFWAINESSDLTLNEYVMEKRGFMHGIEYRARPAPDTTGWIRFDWLYDKVRETDDTTGRYSGDDLLRTNPERFWLRGMLDTRLPDPDWRFKADLDYVSDQYFLSEFKDGFSGFRRSRNELFELFNRELQEKDRDRVSGFLLTRDWERATIAFSSFYTQDPTLGHGNKPFKEDDTVQRLPQFDAFLHKGRIFPSLPLEIEANAQAGYMYRRSGTRGARYEIVPRVTVPVSTRYGSLIASAGVVQTMYETERPSHSGEDGDTMPRQDGDSRTLPEVNIAGTTEFARVFALDKKPLPLTNSTVGQSQWTALRHSIQPRLEYRYRVNDDQDDNPYYSSDDRLVPKSELVYSITNVLTTKKESVVLTKNDAGEMTPSLKTAYVDLVRFRLEQAYDYREATRTDERDKYPRRPFGDVFSDLSLYVNEYMSLSTRNNWSPYLNEFTRHQSGVTFGLPEYGSIYVGYDLREALDEYSRKRDDDIKYLRLDLKTAAFGPWSLSASFKHDFENLDNKETDIKLSFNHQCFTVIGQVSVEPREENYQLFVLLTGLGD